jgi:hypothetical protein
MVYIYCICDCLILHLGVYVPFFGICGWSFSDNVVLTIHYLKYCTSSVIHKMCIN